jgi:hypothetical protein
MEAASVAIEKAVKFSMEMLEHNLSGVSEAGIKIWSELAHSIDAIGFEISREIRRCFNLNTVVGSEFAAVRDRLAAQSRSGMAGRLRDALIEQGKLKEAWNKEIPESLRNHNGVRVVSTIVAAWHNLSFDLAEIGASAPDREFRSLKKEHVAVFTIPLPDLRAERIRVRVLPNVPSSGYIPADHPDLKNQLIVAHMQTGPLVFRFFDAQGQTIVSAPESRLRAKHARRIDAVRARIGDLIKPLDPRAPRVATEPELSRALQQELVGLITPVLDLNPLIRMEYNPFRTLYNVRITKVRPWVLGVRTDKMCHVGLRHLGDERIRRPDKTIVELGHKPVRFQFRYDWSKVVWNEAGGYVENPPDALKHGGIDGDLKLEGDLKGSSYLPLIGPFARWEIEFDPDANNGLDLSGVTAIAMDFHGYSQSHEK